MSRIARKTHNNRFFFIASEKRHTTFAAAKGKSGHCCPHEQETLTSLTNKSKRIMKKIFAVALMAMMTLAANAQVFVGGAVSYSSEKALKGSKSVNTFTLAPEVGYNFNENWTAGLTINFTSEDDGNQTTTATGLGVYGRYNYLKSGIATLFVEADVDYTAYNHDAGNTFGIGLMPGLSLALSDRLSLVAKTGVLGYAKNSDKRGGGSAFGIGVNNTDLSFGLYYNF